MVGYILHQLKGLRSERERFELILDGLNEERAKLLADFLASPNMSGLAKRIEVCEATIGELKGHESDLRSENAKTIWEWARETLEGAKTRTIEAACKIELRAMPRTVKVLDEAKAIAWGEEYAPETVKKSFLVSKMGKAYVTALEIDDPDYSPALKQAVALSAPSESLTIDGVKVGTFEVQA